MSTRMSRAMAGEESIPTRRSLLERLKNWQDAASWQEFFDTYWKLIYGVARHAGLSEAEAQDVVQETVVSVARKMEGFRTDPAYGSFKSWLMQITRRRIADQLRKRSARREWAGMEDDGTEGTPVLERIPDPAGAGLEEIWQKEWERNLVEVALEKVKRQVSSRQFMFFYQQAFKEWKPQKVAEKYGVSMAQVYMAKYRVGGVFKRELRKVQRELERK